MSPAGGAGGAGGGPLVDLAVEVAGIRLKNPVLVASGCFGYGREYAPLFDLGRLGGVMVKGVSLDPWPGNPGPRVAETPAGMLNSVGLQNPGVDHFLREELPWLRQFDTAVIVNVVGRTADEYRAVAARLEGVAGVAGLELNISCPNIKEGGLSFGRAPEAAAALVAAVRAETGLPLLVKLTPNTADLAGLARAVAAAGADALSAINTLIGLAIDADTGRPVLGTVLGGLSGPAVKPVALAAVWEAARATGLPVVGMGGIRSGRDAAEFLLAGATAVAVGTALFVDPLAAVRVVAELEEFLIRKGVRRAADLVGGAWPERRGTPPPLAGRDASGAAGRRGAGSGGGCAGAG